LSTGGALFLLLTLALCSALILAPAGVGRRRRRRDSRPAGRREQLRSQYELVLQQLRELEEDRLTGKLEPAAHAQEREAWLRRGAQLLAQLDALEQDAQP